MQENIREEIKKKLLEFKQNIYKTDDELFVELCFCIIVANNSIENGLRAYNSIGLDFLTLDEKKLKERLKNTSRRFYNKRAEYIVEAREKKEELVDNIHKLKDNKIKESEFRDWLVKNIKGVGYKEASHYMRNLGYFNFAILDRHILKFLHKQKIIDKVPKSLNKKEYFRIEKILIDMSKKLNMSMAELDIYLFYLDSGRICEK
jgi:N-glycosylase/DNA lyase